jgi:hypothetical protein
MSNANEKVTIETLLERIVALETKVDNMSSRNRGPKSTRAMTDEDAQKVKFGGLKDHSHKAAAKALGLSYGQIYSCRGGYTFTHVKK